MGTLDAPARKLSVKLIEKFGKQITLRFVSAGAYDPDTLSSAITPTDQTVRAIIEQYRARFQMGETGSAVREGDRQAWIAAKGLTRAPTTADRVVIDSEEYEILNLDPVYSGDQVAIYALHVRR